MNAVKTLCDVYGIVREEVEGPFTVEQIRQQVAAGRMTAGLLCAEPGSTAWQPGAELLAERDKVPLP